MIRPVALAIVLALVGCQSADVQRAQPTLTIPARLAGRRWPGQPGGGRMVGAIFMTVPSISNVDPGAAL
ncbi:Uncharacterised protein [Klebsiella pneumoniae subsp. ozaenae]|uniref:Uncharacterized protein n=1 Tax=Klebsiella pneumoniae subsp. ozaenae TaxID=574 RepID=A0A378B0Z5_KLEPO|nr:Uncharacterised protein [Klebsiella pneumoniae subsp. ozaenae]